VATTVLAWGLFPASSQAKDRAGLFSISGAMTWGLMSPDALNRQLQFDNLTFAVALEEMTTFTEVIGELRYGVSNPLSGELQVGYLWQDSVDGRVTRKLSAFPVTLSLVYFLVSAKSALTQMRVPKSLFAASSRAATLIVSP